MQGNENYKQSSINKFLTELGPDSSTEYSLWKVNKIYKKTSISYATDQKTDGR
jgi:hypothetical protein